jgi:xylose isomerase
MKLATRLNSLLPKYENNFDLVFQELQKTGITHVDFNYPEHVKNYTTSEMKALMGKYNLSANGIALRFRDEFIKGELGNVDISISKKAVQLCKEAIDFCKGIGGEVVTIWLAFDGFDYAFQIDYIKVWDQIKACFTEIADYDPSIKISIEYKPYEERSYAFLDTIGLTALMVNEVNRENLGMTLDYCHMLMKHENPAFSVSIATSRGKLFGVHLNDGYGVCDDGLMVGSVTLLQTIEFLYYVKLSNYDHAIYFDTFPKREDGTEECIQNVTITKKIFEIIDRIGMDEFKKVIEKNSGIEVHKLLLKILN